MPTSVDSVAHWLRYAKPTPVRAAMTTGRVATCERAAQAEGELSEKPVSAPSRQLGLRNTHETLLVIAS